MVMCLREIVLCEMASWPSVKISIGSTAHGGKSYVLLGFGQRDMSCLVLARDGALIWVSWKIVHQEERIPLRQSSLLSKSHMMPIKVGSRPHGQPRPDVNSELVPGLGRRSESMSDHGRDGDFFAGRETRWVNASSRAREVGRRAMTWVHFQVEVW